MNANNFTFSDVVKYPGEFRTTLKHELFAESSSSTYRGVSAFIGITFAVLGAATVFAVLARKKRGTLWWKKDGRRGTPYILNGPVLVQIIMGVYFLIAAEQVGVFYFSSSAMPVSFTLQLVLFAILAVAGAVQVWSTISALSYRRSLVSLPHKSDAHYNPTRVVFFLRKLWSGKLANALFFLTPAAILGSLVPLAVRAGVSHTQLIHTWQKVDSLLANANATQSWSETNLELIELYATEMNTEQATLQADLQQIAGAYTAWVILGMALYIPFTWVTFSLLGKQIGYLKKMMGNASQMQTVRPATTQTPAVHVSLSPNPFDEQIFSASPNPQAAAAENNSEDPFSDLARVPTHDTTAPQVPPKSLKSHHSSANEAEEELLQKTAKLQAARRIILVNGACWSVTALSYAILSFIQIAGGLSTGMGYHNYLVWLLWFPAFAVLLPAIVTTGLFVLRSFSKQPVKLDASNSSNYARSDKAPRSPYQNTGPADSIVEFDRQSPFALEGEDDAATVADQPPVSPRPDVPRSIRDSGLSINMDSDDGHEQAMFARAERVTVATPSIRSQDVAIDLSSSTQSRDEWVRWGEERTAEMDRRWGTEVKL